MFIFLFQELHTPYAGPETVKLDCSDQIDNTWIYYASFGISRFFTVTTTVLVVVDAASWPREGACSRGAVECSQSSDGDSATKEFVTTWRRHDLSSDYSRGPGWPCSCVEGCMRHDVPKLVSDLDTPVVHIGISVCRMPATSEGIMWDSESLESIKR